GALPIFWHNNIMNISEEKWSIQQPPQVPPSPQHQHSTMSPQMNVKQRKAKCIPSQCKC
ncbi:7985_t:CDS:2, partial [Cetraspora pellucida]